MAGWRDAVGRPGRYGILPEAEPSPMTELRRFDGGFLAPVARGTVPSWSAGSRLAGGRVGGWQGGRAWADDGLASSKGWRPKTLAMKRKRA